MSAKLRPEIPALGLTIAQAQAALSVGDEFWREHVAHEIRLVRLGSRKIVPVSELQRWLDAHAELATGEVSR